MSTPEEHTLPTRRATRERERERIEATARERVPHLKRAVAPKLVQDRKTPGRRPLARRAIATVAVTFVGAMVLATSLPAAALFPDSDATALPSPQARESQSLEVGSGGELTVVARDSYSATSMEELEQQKAAVAAVAPARTASTFINNPSSPVQWPFVTGVPLSDDFGPRAAPCDGCSTFHKGLDLIPGEGTQIQAIADGVVRETGSSDSGLGVYAMIDHVVDGQLYTSVYAHMQFGSLKLEKGEAVAVGQAVGSVGNTGQSTGPHLHLELLRDGTEPIDPFAWLQANVQL